MLPNRLLLLTVPLSILPLGCGGSGSGGSSGSATGQFLDAEVSGLEVRTGGASRVTREDGSFDYDPGAVVEFRLGGTTLGSAIGDDTLTPIDLVPGAVDETDARVTNMARLLQTIDDDDDPENGIEITERVRREFSLLELDLDQSVLQFENDPALRDALIRIGKSGDLVPMTAARSHLRRSMFRRSAGFYQGTIEGDLDGELIAVIDDDADFLGFLLVDGRDRPILIEGDIDSDRNGSFDDDLDDDGDDDDDEDFEFIGRFGRTASGQWFRESTGESGTFMARRSVNRTSPPSAPARRLEGDYEAELTFDFDNDPDTADSTIEIEIDIDDDGDIDLSTYVDGVEDDETSIVYTSANANRADFVGIDDRGLLIEGTVRRNGDLQLMLSRIPRLDDSVVVNGSRR